LREPDSLTKLRREGRRAKAAALAEPRATHHGTTAGDEVPLFHICEGDLLPAPVQDELTELEISLCTGTSPLFECARSTIALMKKTPLGVGDCSHPDPSGSGSWAVQSRDTAPLATSPSYFSLPSLILFPLLRLRYWRWEEAEEPEGTYRQIWGYQTDLEKNSHLAAILPHDTVSSLFPSPPLLTPKLPSLL